MGGSIDDKVKPSNSIAEARKEISAAVSKQYENKPVELKKEPEFYGLKVKSTDGANEHDYALEKGVKVDYEKLFDYLGSGSKGKNIEAEAGEYKKAVAEEKKGEMSVEELKEFMNKTFVNEMMRSGDRTEYEDKERFYRAIMFPEGLVWFKYQESTAGIRNRETNFSLNNMLN